MDKEQFKDKDNQKDKEIERLTDEELDKVSGGKEPDYDDAHCID